MATHLNLPYMYLLCVVCTGCIFRTSAKQFCSDDVEGLNCTSDPCSESIPIPPKLPDLPSCPSPCTLDNQAPTYSNCPNPWQVILPEGSTTFRVIWTEPVATDNVGVIDTQQTHHPGDEFPEGVNTVTYTSTDQAGHQADCEFTITVTLPLVPLVPLVALVVIICVISFAVILILGCLTCFLRIRQRRIQRQYSIHGQEMESCENKLTREEQADSTTDYKPVGVDQSSSYEPIGVGSASTYEDVGLPTWARPWSVLWRDMMVGSKVLGEGHFGEVRRVMIEEELCKAVIKKLKENASPDEKKNFLEEFRSMTQVTSHPNIVKILGACQREGELYVALEYLPNGDLRSYLRKARSKDDESHASLSSDKLLQFALDVATGMQHLAASGVIHRDLAARNILLDVNLVAKVSDFGLSRGEDIYVQTSKTRVPTRWLSPESLSHQRYTSKSDVWSYGILLWEIATLGGTPYSGIKTKFLKSRLENGYRMPKPSNCDDKIYGLMLQCWQDDPGARPLFKKLVSVITTMAAEQSDQTYMSLLPMSEEYRYVNIRPELDDN